MHVYYIRVDRSQALDIRSIRIYSKAMTFGLEDVDASYARRLRRALEKKGWTQAQLARELGVIPCVVNKWAIGKQRPSLRFALRLQTLLGIDPGSWHWRDA